MELIEPAHQQEGLLVGDKVCQASVSSQEVEKEAFYPGNSPSLLPGHGPSPYLSAFPEVCLSPSLSQEA